MASKGFSSGFRALARASRATPRVATRPASSQAQAPTPRSTLCLSTTPIQSIPRVFMRALSSTPTRQEQHSNPGPSTPTRQEQHSNPGPSTTAPGQHPPANTPKQPSYELTFTCVPCGTRSAHNVSKQGYHHGSVLITCPSCRNRHIISDHLNIFGNRKITVEELLKERGQLVKRGTLGEDGDIEFWEDGSTTTRSERQADGNDPKPKAKSEPAAEEGQGAAPGASFGKA